MKNYLHVLKSRRGQIWLIVIVVGGALVFFAPQDEPVTLSVRHHTVPQQLIAKDTGQLQHFNTSITTSNNKSELAEVKEAAEICDKEAFCAPKHDWHFRSYFKITPADAFRPLIYTPPPLPPAAPLPSVIIASPPPPPPKPVAPALPFKYLGKIGEHHAVQKDEEMYELIVGQTLADHYKVESLTEEQATLIYLPLQERQVLLLRNE